MRRAAAMTSHGVRATSVKRVGTWIQPVLPTMSGLSRPVSCLTVGEPDFRSPKGSKGDFYCGFY